MQPYFETEPCAGVTRELFENAKGEGKYGRAKENQHQSHRQRDRKREPRAKGHHPL
jgi:hypothetical protein